MKGWIVSIWLAANALMWMHACERREAHDRHLEIRGRLQVIEQELSRPHRCGMGARAVSPPVWGEH